MGCAPSAQFLNGGVEADRRSLYRVDDHQGIGHHAAAIVRIYLCENSRLVDAAEPVRNVRQAFHNGVFHCTRKFGTRLHFQQAADIDCLAVCEKHRFEFALQIGHALLEKSLQLRDCLVCAERRRALKVLQCLCDALHAVDVTVELRLDAPLHGCLDLVVHIVIGEDAIDALDGRDDVLLRARKRSVQVDRSNGSLQCQQPLFKRREEVEHGFCRSPGSLQALLEKENVLFVAVQLGFNLHLALGDALRAQRNGRCGRFCADGGHGERFDLATLLNADRRRKCSEVWQSEGLKGTASKQKRLARLPCTLR
eukprot:Opistho-1_new@59065